MDTVVLSKYGQDVYDNLVKHAPDPVLIIGDTGWGKTTLLKHFANQNDLEFTGVNFYPKMSVDTLVGMWRPLPTANGITVEWQDGVLTDAIRNGKIFLGEELTRAPRDLAGRLLGVLDSAERYWSLPEAGVSNVEVNEGFWFLASANPVNGSYSTVSIDPALLRRFSYVCEINQPLADEALVVSNIAEGVIASHSDFVKRLLSWVKDLRKSASTNINTGDLVRVAKAVVIKRIQIVDAVNQTLGYKYKEIDAIQANLSAHFETFSLDFLKQQEAKRLKTSRKRVAVKAVTEQVAQVAEPELAAEPELVAEPELKEEPEQEIEPETVETIELVEAKEEEEEAETDWFKVINQLLHNK